MAKTITVSPTRTGNEQDDPPQREVEHGSAPFRGKSGHGPPPCPAGGQPSDSGQASMAFEATGVKA